MDKSLYRKLRYNPAFAELTLPQLEATVERTASPRYQLQDSDGTTFGPVCPVWHDEAAAMNRELARDGFDYRWSLL